MPSKLVSYSCNAVKIMFFSTVFLTCSLNAQVIDNNEDELEKQIQADLERKTYEEEEHTEQSVTSTPTTNHESPTTRGCRDFPFCRPPL